MLSCLESKRNETEKGTRCPYFSHPSFLSACRQPDHHHFFTNGNLPHLTSPAFWDTSIPVYVRRTECLRKHTWYPGDIWDKGDAANSLDISLNGRAEGGPYFSRQTGSEIPKHKGWSLQMPSPSAFHLPCYLVSQWPSQTHTFPSSSPILSPPPHLHFCL